MSLEEISLAKMSLEEQFKIVADSVWNWEKEANTSDSLALFSLYKQATIGDVNMPKPSGLVEKAKFKAWSGRMGLSKEDAQKQYIELAEKLRPKYNK